MTIEQAFAAALQHHRAGRLEEAIAAYRQCIALAPHFPEARSNLGVALKDTGRLDEAIAAYRAAIAIKPHYAEAHSNLGVALMEKGEVDEAIAACRQAIAIKPFFPDAHYNLGNALYAERALDEAIAAYRAALALRPHYPEAHSNLGNALKAAGQLEEAIAAYRRAIALHPRHAEAHGNLGAALRESGRLDEAVAACRQGIALRPNYPEAHGNLGSALRDQGQWEHAVAAYRQAVALKPDFAEAWSILGETLREHGQLEEAIVACRQAIALTPDSPEAHTHLGDALRDHGQLEEAIATHRQAIALRPDDAEAHTHLGNALHDRGQLDEAITAYRQAIALKPSLAEAHSNLGGALNNNGQFDEGIAAHRQALLLKPDLSRGHSNLIFALDLMEGADFIQQQEERRRWDEQHARKYAERIPPHENEPDPARRLRVGYVSADFRQHSACSVFAPVVCGHDAAAFEVFCYSGVMREDGVTARLRGAVHAWRSTVGMPDDALAAQIRQDRIDILVDLSGHSAGNRLLVFARKPAPVQVTAWGHATGTGMRTMDYFFADARVVPAAERAHFAEEVIDLPWALCYEPPEYLPEVSPLPVAQGHPLTYGCVNRLAKISDRAIALWGRILDGAPGSRLLVKEKRLDHAGVREQFVRRLHAVGRIATDRVVLVGSSPHNEHLRIFHRIDVGLDPFPMGGGVSTAEALWMGVPLVTLEGATVPGRITASLLSQLGMEDWIAQTDDDYVAIALRAGREPARVAELRQNLRERLRASPCGDAQRYTRAVEQAYRLMWRKWCGNACPLRPS